MKKLLSLLLMLSLLCTPITSLAANESDSFHSQRPSSTTYDHLGDTEWVQGSSLEDAWQKVKSEKPAGTDYVYWTSNTTTCYHYFDIQIGPIDVCSAGSSDYVYKGRVEPNGWFTLPASVMADKQDHTYRVGNHSGGYMIWLFRYKATATVQGKLQPVYCSVIGDKYDKVYPGGFCCSTKSLDLDMTQDYYTKSVPFGHQLVNWIDAPGGSYGVHGKGMCYDNGPGCNTEYLHFGDGAALLSDGTTHSMTVYRFSFYKSSGYQIVYNENKPAWGIFKNMTGYMPTEKTTPNTSFNLSKNLYSLQDSTFKGWNTKPDGTGTSYTDQQRVSNLAPPGSTIQLYAQWETTWEGNPIKLPDNKILYSSWRPINYKVIYDSNNGTGDTFPHPETLKYDREYSPLSQEQTGFSKTGYYIKYWYYKPFQNRYTPHDKDWPAGTNKIKEYFKNLTYIDNDTVTVQAKWEPIKYTIRIHENYAGVSDRTKDYVVKYDQDFKLPYPSPWSNNGVVVGYDLNKTVKIAPRWANQDYVRNLTDQREAIIDIYTIWDIPPRVTTSVSEIHLSRLKCAASLLNQDNGTISKSDLEAELMTYATATDYEWQYRYGGNVPPGNNKGYTFGISSFEPATIIDAATNEETQVYYITFTCTDDAGQSAQASITLFIGNIDVDILVH